MLKTEILGFNGIVLRVDSNGILQSVHTGQTPIESENLDGFYDSVLLLGQYQNELLPILINADGELL